MSVCLKQIETLRSLPARRRKQFALRSPHVFKMHKPANHAANPTDWQGCEASKFDIFRFSWLGLAAWLQLSSSIQLERDLRVSDAHIPQQILFQRGVARGWGNRLGEQFPHFMT